MTTCNVNGVAIVMNPQRTYFGSLSALLQRRFQTSGQKNKEELARLNPSGNGYEFHDNLPSRLLLFI